MSARKYRLPDELGGREVEVLHGFARNDDRIDVKVPGVGIITLSSTRMLVVVPLPEEPTEQGWYLATIGGTEAIARKVETDGWSMGRDNGFLSTWKTLNEDFPGITVVRLIPAPEPMELPWEHTDRERYTIGIHESNRHWAACRVGFDDNAVDLTPEAAREMARALWTVADEHEAEATS